MWSQNKIAWALVKNGNTYFVVLAQATVTEERDLQEIKVSPTEEKIRSLVFL